jgi:predicted PurR-regulated permease PerM
MADAKRLILWTLAVGIVVYLAWLLRNTLLLVYMSAVFAVVLSPAVDWVCRLRIGRWHPGRAVSILLIIGVVLVLLTVFLLLALPPLVSDIDQLIQQLPERVQRLQEDLRSVPFLRQINVQTIAGYASSLIGGLTGLVSTTAGALVSLAAVIVLTAYLILDGARVFDWTISLLPPEISPRLRLTLLRAVARMRRWLVGQAMLMLILGLYSAVVFGLLGVRYFYLLAVFAGVANIIPMLGPVLTVILAGTVAAIDSFAKLIGVVVLYLAYQQVESAFLTPRIMKMQVKLSATAVLVALLIGGALAGISGALLAVPTAVLVSELAEEYLIHRPEERR